MKVLILGSGSIGKFVAFHLQKMGFSVTLASNDGDALSQIRQESGDKIEIHITDLKNPQTVKKLAKKSQIAVNALPGGIGFQALKWLIEAGVKKITDVSFYEEDCFSLQQLAEEKGSTVLTSLGVAPGMSHAIAAHLAGMLDEVHEIEMCVGGMPTVWFSYPYNYFKTWGGATDVFLEFTRDARYLQNWKVKTINPFETIGTRVFSFGGRKIELGHMTTDGVVTLLNPELKLCPNIVEKTLRPPGHFENLKILKDDGKFLPDQIVATAAELNKQWERQPGDRDMTIMFITAKGTINGNPESVNCSLIHQGSDETLSMSTVTGLPVCAGVKILAEDMVQEARIIPPEWLGTQNDLMEFLFNFHRQEGVSYL